jgi:serine/threonine protein kinase
LVRKRGGADDGHLYAMKVLDKVDFVDNKKVENAETERLVLEVVRHKPFLVTLRYSFQTDEKIYLVMGE